MYYWLCGNFVNHESDAEDTDEWALANGYISICPVKIDYTDYQIKDQISGWEFTAPDYGSDLVNESIKSSNC